MNFDATTAPSLARPVDQRYVAARHGAQDKKAQLSIRLCRRLLDRIDEVGAQLDRSRSWLIQDAIRSSLENDAFGASAGDTALEAGVRRRSDPGHGSKARVSVRVSLGLLQQLDRRGAAVDRSRSWLVQRALAGFFADDA